MVANVLATGIAALWTAVVAFKQRRAGHQTSSFLYLMAFGFAMLAIEALQAGSRQPTSVGQVVLSTAVIAMMADTLQRSGSHTQ